MTSWMHVLHIRGGNKAAWARLHRDQDLNHLDVTPEGEDFEKQLYELD